jgi:hypothetical protein
MTTINTPIGQHDLPMTYLKWFAIDPNDRRFKSIVYCFWKNQYEAKIKQVSINSEKFKKDDFYTINHSIEPYFVENFFSSEIEPLYNNIMAEVESEISLPAALPDVLHPEAMVSNLQIHDKNKLQHSYIRTGI